MQKTVVTGFWLRVSWGVLGEHPSGEGEGGCGGGQGTNTQALGRHADLCWKNRREAAEGRVQGPQGAAGSLPRSY